MSDLVERLNNAGGRIDLVFLCHEAAERIAELEAENSSLRQAKNNGECAVTNILGKAHNCSGVKLQKVIREKDKRIAELEAELKQLRGERQLIRVDPQPEYIEASGRWKWPLPKCAQFDGCCKSVYTGSREWWEYAPSEAKPHPMAEGVMLRDYVWYWAFPASN